MPAKLELGIGQDQSAIERPFGAEAVERQAQPLERLGHVGAGTAGELGARDILVMSGQRLGRRGEDRLGEPVAFLEPGRQRLAGDGAGLPVVLPARPGEIAAHHAFEHDGLRQDDSLAALIETGKRREQLCWDRLIPRKVISDQTAGLAEPGT